MDSNETTIDNNIEREKLYREFLPKLKTDKRLSRKLVSFQANKEEPIYRWFKYKEGFSSKLVKYFIQKYHPQPGKVLDPFAGVGTTLFASQELGWESTGIELLPVGVFVMEVRDAVRKVDYQDFKQVTAKLWNKLNELNHNGKAYFNHITITQNAFPEETERQLNKYLAYCETIEDRNIQKLLYFAAFSVLEEISYTRKDGQYLRWDYRANRSYGKTKFDKGKIYPFKEALKTKINQLSLDLNNSSNGSQTLFDFSAPVKKQYSPKIITGSCLEEMPKLKEDYLDFIVTSPPYCNRYDYTRTYALELIFLGCDNEQVKNLRQQMLSCTVENKEKIKELKTIYQHNEQENVFDQVMEVYNNCSAMQEINNVLQELNNLNQLNNSNIPRMVKNYFLEMCFVIYEMSRVLRKKGHVVMVNDNVRYGGQEVPVDIILSDFAQNFGLKTDNIFVLPKGKGNSSQQMGSYGRTEIRKCVYVWQKS